LLFPAEYAGFSSVVGYLSQGYSIVTSWLLHSYSIDTAGISLG